MFAFAARSCIKKTSVILTIAALQVGAAHAQAKQQPHELVIGIVVVSEAPVGVETIASATPEPERYQNTPGVRVVQVKIPLTSAQAASSSGGATASLKGDVIDMGDGKKQPADGPLKWIATAEMALATFSVFQSDAPTQPIASASFPVEQPPATSGNPAGNPAPNPAENPRGNPAPNSPGRPPGDAPANPPGNAPNNVPRNPGNGGPTAPPNEIPPGVSMPGAVAQGGIQVVHCTECGLMTVTFDDQPVHVAAAKPGTEFWDVPENAAPGPHHVTVVTGPGKPPITMTIYVIALAMSAGQTHLLRGQSTWMRVILTGLQSLPASAWHSGLPPSDLINYAHLHQNAPDFHAPHSPDDGVVLLVLENQSPNVIRMGGHGDRIVLQIHQSDVANGLYTFQETLQSLQDGGFNIVGTVYLFLDQVTASPNAPHSN